MLFDLCLCVGSVAQRDKASDYESEESRFESWQSLFFQRIKKTSTPECDDYKVGLHEGLLTTTYLTRWFGNDGGILVLDDLMAEGGNDKQVLDLFTKHSHHRNITVIYLCQDMFPRKKYAKTINRQAHYIVAFKSPRDKLGLKNLLLQAFPNRWKDVMDVFDRATRRPFGYIMLDLHPVSDNRMRVFADLLHKEGITKGYRIKEVDENGSMRAT